MTGSLLVLLLAQFIGIWPFAARVAFAGTPPTTRGSMTFQKFLQLTTRPRQPITRPLITAPLPKTQSSPPAFSQLPPTAQPPTMQPITQPLSAAELSGAPGTPPLDLLGSDHRLELQIAPGSFDLSHASELTSAASSTHTRTQPGPSSSPTPTVTPSPTPAVTSTGTPARSATPTPTPAATSTATPSPTPSLTPSPSPSPTPAPSGVSGPFTLVVRELHGQYVGMLSMLGSYQLQVLDGRGKPLTGIVLRHPLTILYHYQPQDLTGLDLDPGKLFLAWSDPHATKQQVAQDIIPFTNTSTTQTLSAQSMLLHPGPFEITGDPQNQSPPIIHEASVQGNAGQLSYSYPLQVAPGPDGFAPQLTLSYSSDTTNEVHSYLSPAGPAGEGWSLSLGSITEEPYPSSSADGSGTWFFLSGVDGISDRLIQDTTISGGTFFQTEHVSHLRIQELNPTSATPCFAVWDESGAYYQFGCTQDALQYRKDSDGTAHIYRFDLNAIIAPNEGQSATEKQILVSYLQECGSQSGSCPALTASGTTSIRDASIKQIQYGSVPHGATLDNGGFIDGTVDFHYLAPEAVTNWATAYGTNYNCSSSPPTSTTLRCDDPLGYNGGNPQPTVMSVLTLAKISSYVGPDNLTNGSGGYPAYEDEFSYQDTPFSSGNPAQNNAPCADPTTNPPVKEYCAGEHDLTQIAPAVFQNGSEHTLKPVLFHYYSFTNTYSDRSNPLPGGAPYIVTIDRDFLDYSYDSDSGTGAHIDYGRAYNNTHGTPDVTNNQGQVIDNRSDPLFCYAHAFDQYTCNSGSFQYPDDHAWTAQVVTQITALGADSSALSAATTTYLYTLVKIPNVTCPADQANPPDTDCVGDNWIPKNVGNGNKDQDWADFYHGEYRGFYEVSTISPSGDLTEDAYSTEGWWTPNSNASNYNTGARYEQDVYQGAAATAGALLQKTTSAYTGFHDNNSCDGLLDQTYAPCLVMAESTTTTMYEGQSSGPSVTTSYTYDDYSSSGGLSVYHYHNLDEEKIVSNNAPEIDKVWSYAPNDSGYPGGSWIYYDVNKVAHSEIDDTGSPVRKYQCTASTYDEGTGTSLPDAGLLTTTATYSSSGCTPGSYGTPLTTTYAGYDAYGNPVAAVDGVAQANAALYGSTGTSGKNGCTLQTAPAVMSSAWGKSNYTTCTSYDVYNAQPQIVANAFDQTTQTQYDPTQGSLPIQVTDANGKATTTTYSYDANSATNGKRIVQVSEPGETPGSYTTQANSSSSCQTSLPSGTITPCYENDSLSSSYPNALSQTFYDAAGRVVETSTPSAVPAGGSQGTSYYTIVLTMYNDAAHSVWQSLPFIYAGSASGAGWLDPKAGSTVDYKGNVPTGTITYADALSRSIAVQDPLLGTASEPGHTCPSLQQGDPNLSSFLATTCTVYGLDSASGDSNQYDAATVIDANAHVSETMTDALGNTRHVLSDSGSSGGTLTPNEQIDSAYNVLNEPTSVTTTDKQPQSGETTQSVTVTMTYDELGRLVQLSDPDRGTHSYTYDADGRVTSDVSGTRTLGESFDLLGRLGCEQTAAPTQTATGACTGGSPLVQNTYDVSAPGVTWSGSDYPVGRLTQSVETTYYPTSNQATTTESVQYDQRGRIQTQQLQLGVPSGWNLTTALPVYQLSQGYTDANQPTTTQTSTIVNGTSTPGYTVTQDYDTTSGVLVGLSNNTGNTPNIASLLLGENAQPATLTSYTSAGSSSILATEQFTYYGDLRPQTDTASWGSGSGASGQIASESRWYDAAGNVDSLSTTQAAVPGKSGSGGSETENFCYDEQNRLLLASNTLTPAPSGSQTCGNQTPANSLNGASYTTSYVYTHLGQLWQGPVAGGSTTYQYLYCGSAPHQLTGLFAAGSTCASKSGSVYKSSYDTFGNVTSRTYSGTTATLSYDSRSPGQMGHGQQHLRAVCLRRGGQPNRPAHRYQQQHHHHRLRLRAGRIPVQRHGHAHQQHPLLRAGRQARRGRDRSGHTHHRDVPHGCAGKPAGNVQ